ncbi:MAG: acyl-CoA dehydratase activase-related protein [Bacteroidales bacterium]|nr:acyl-CoA dehydratase activase-related protein [Bacteroidales bacterium]
MNSIINIGLDAGSTTVKVAALDSEGKLLFKDYRRHHANISCVLAEIFTFIQEKIGDTKVRLTLTGSAGMGIAERCKLPFIQEVVSSCGYIASEHPEIKTLVDIGGEDAKMIFFCKKKTPDIRMNGNCAGGTGSFIDQMANILNVDVNELGALAENATTIYPIASRCGVFSKTDVQNLLSRNVNKEDIAASVFHAVSMQVLTSLSRGYDILPKIFLCGGPFHFIPALRKAFQEELKAGDSDIVVSENSEIIPAWGAAINASKLTETKTLAEYIRIFEEANHQTPDTSKRLKALFANDAEFNAFNESKSNYHLKQTTFEELSSDECYIGIDSGSTTTKIVAVDTEGRLFYHFYEKNKGLSLETVDKGLAEFNQKAIEAGKNLKVAGSCVTGYGEDLLKKAFNMENGVVETIAHYTAACHFEPRVSFILDIGGQDMKAAFIEGGTIKRLEINEACSSGCGSFIETFAQSLGYKVADFSKVAGSSKYPCDLGTRCTVFMNSKVKQFLREGASVADISAGLGYSVIKNCLNKVLKIKDFSEMGDFIMVQGGTFRNQALIRAFEIETGKSVIVTDLPELMGAYGAALFAQKKKRQKSVPLSEFVKVEKYTGNKTQCKGCENQCAVTCFTFDNGNKYFAGNKCEKMVSNLGSQNDSGVNLYTEKYRLLMDRKAPQKEGAITIGIPRALGIYEDYPFWHTLFTGCGFNVQLSDKSTMKLYETGIKTVMADNICFPAKITNGHILNLIEKKVDRIFLPFVVYESKEDKNTPNSYNCPIVTGYSEVIRSAIDPAGKHGIPLDAPTFTFKNEKLKKKACVEYILSLPGSIEKKDIEKAYQKAIEEQKTYQERLTIRCKEVLKNAKEHKRLVVLLAGRPYHSDPLIQHKLAQVIADFGTDVITEDVIRCDENNSDKIQSIMQWAYTNRILKAANWAANADENIHYIELTSFGCGPDSFIIDEVSDILRRGGKNATFLKIDDINNIGSMRLRIRSLIESLRYKSVVEKVIDTKAIQTKPFTTEDRKRTILMPWFGDFYSPLLPAVFKLCGYDAINLAPSDRQSVEYGLKYSNNEICYPATLIVGDFMKALDSGKYDPDKIALAISQTGGQCRATNYAALLKKALTTAGLEKIPVITIAMGGGVNEQPGFKINWKKIYKVVIYALIYTDFLSQMYYSTAPREKVKGEAKRIKDKMLQLGIKAAEANDAKRFLDLASIACKRFTEAVEIKNIPQIGIVGEIYVKYNRFGHKNVVNWLVNQGVETVLPPITDFFTSTFVNQTVRESGNVDRRRVPKPIYDFAEHYIYRVVHLIEDRVKSFPYFRPFVTPEKMADSASKIINLNAQFGEGWGIPGDYAHFAENGINRVVSLQPFGCIANQVISKGIEKRVREIYPNLNLLFLDFDSGMSEANIMNRLHFMIENAI